MNEKPAAGTDMAWEEDMDRWVCTLTTRQGLAFSVLIYGSIGGVGHRDVRRTLAEAVLRWRRAGLSRRT